MNTATKVRAIGRGLVIMSLILLALRLAVYVAGKLLILAGYVGGTLFLAGAVLWFVGAVMSGYKSRP